MFPLTQQDYELLLYRGPYDVPGYPFFNLQSPGAPPPGPSFVAHATALGDEAAPAQLSRRRAAPEAPVPIGRNLALLYFRALYDPTFEMPIVSGNKLVPSKIVPGHRFHTAEYGPTPSPVMVIGKWPGREEVQQQRNLVGDTSEHLWRACEDLGIPWESRKDWYLTNLIKCPDPDPNANRITTLIRDFLPVLWQEIQIVRPQYVLCLGADASKEITKWCPGVCQGREGLGVEKMRGRVEQLGLPMAGRGNTRLVAQVMTIVHPAQVHRTPELTDTMRSGLSAFWELSNGKQIGGAEHDIEHYVIRDEATLARHVDDILNSQDPADSILAIDAEWHGQKPWDPGAYLRTVQFSHRPKYAVCVELHGPGGAPAFQPDAEAATRQLRRLFTHPKMRIGGHFLRADLPWLKKHLGIDLTNQYAPAARAGDVCSAGGWDTSLMEHAVNETGPFGLEVLRLKYTTAPPYEKLLYRWKKQYCREHGLDDDDLEGFGDWGGDDFYYYACYDADVTRRAAGRLFEALQSDRFGHDCRQCYWVSHSASLAVLEMEQNGITPDPARVEELAGVFSAARNALVDAIRRHVNWPEFNPNSDQQCRAVLFGYQFAKKPAPPGCPTVQVMSGETPADAVKRTQKLVASGQLPAPPPGQPGWVITLPAGVITQNLTPITATGKRPLAWEKVVARDAVDEHNPSTGRETLGILSYSNRCAALLRDIRFLTKALQTVIRRPETDPDTGEYMRDEDGDFVYRKGLLSHISSDGLIHTRVSQTKETGRSSSSDPPLQNISKQREDDFKRILGYTEDGKHCGDYLDLLALPQYRHVQRSIFKARPGHVFIESDFAGAEVAALMWMAQDPQGIDDVRRMFLPETSPDFLDIHSTMAVNAFKLNCAPTKKGLKALGKPGLRVAAKNVVFGVPYQRGAEAIARQCREKGVETSVAEAQGLIDYYLQRYRVVAQYLEACKVRAHQPLWIKGAFGRFRRFYWSDDSQVVGEQERQACNYSIQNLVADAVWTALANMWEYRKKSGIDFLFTLQIHDAILLEVPFAMVPAVWRDVFPRCMTDMVDIWPCDLDGRRYPLAQPYHMGGEREIMFRWGEDADDFVSEHLDPQFAGFAKLLESPAHDQCVVETLRRAEQYATGI